jgi:mRNA interferase RelE/StbE
VAYQITILPAALRQLADIPKPDQNRILEKIDALSAEPYPPGAKKLHGKHEFFRFRSGNYRIVYTVEHERLIVLVIRIGPEPTECSFTRRL